MRIINYAIFCHSKLICRLLKSQSASRILSQMTLRTVPSNYLLNVQLKSTNWIQMLAIRMYIYLVVLFYILYCNIICVGDTRVYVLGKLFWCCRMGQENKKLHANKKLVDNFFALYSYCIKSLKC